MHYEVFYSSKRNQHREVQVTDDKDLSAYEAMLIQLDQESPNELLDNVLYYIAGFVVRSLLKSLKCVDCRSALLLDVDNPMPFIKTDTLFMQN